MKKLFLCLLALFFAGCHARNFVLSQQLQSMHDVTEISVWQADTWKEGHKQPSNMRLIKHTANPAQIDLIIKAFKNVKDGYYSAASDCYYLCFKDATGQTKCTHLNVDYDCNSKVISGMCFIDESGKLFDALSAAGLIPPCVAKKTMKPTDYPKNSYDIIYKQADKPI